MTGVTQKIADRKAKDGTPIDGDGVAPLRSRSVSSPEAAGRESQPFQLYPDLADEVERMANTGHVGSMHEWSRFMRHLNAALADRSASEDRSESDSGASTITALREALWKLGEANSRTIIAVSAFYDAVVPQISARTDGDKLLEMAKTVEANADILVEARELLK